MSKKKLWEAPLIGGIAGVIYSISITQNYYDDYIVNFTNNLAPDHFAASRVVYHILKWSFMPCW